MVKTQVRHIPGWSIVRLPDGRVGYLEKKTGGNPWVVVDPERLAVEVKPGDRLEVLYYPVELARQWMARRDSDRRDGQKGTEGRVSEMKQPSLHTVPEPYPAHTLRHLPLRERPAYRIGYIGAGACTLYELLAAVIGGDRQIGIAQTLLARYGSLAELSRASAQELAQVKGLGPSKAASLQAALELGRRMVVEASGDKPQLCSPTDVAQLLMAEMSHLEQEHFRVLYLDTRNRLLGSETLYVGSLNAAHIRVGEVFRGAVRRNCAAIIVAHNHPSGDPTPSPEDVAVTRELVTAGKLLDIEVLDHLIIGHQCFVSLRERGLGFGGQG